MSAGPVYIEPSRRLIFDKVATISPGASLSNAVPLRSYELKGLIIPAGFSGTSISFQAAPPGLPPQITAGQFTGGQPEAGTYYDVYDDSDVPVQVAVSGSSQYIVLSVAVSEKLAGVDNIKVRSGLPSAPTLQTSTSPITLIVGASTK